ncbi:MAG TPA: hypothetical protein VFQ77_12525 [Pseudonocardiaceae bacterium]|nr:hypothetical protein [Pseudonocardiaceae bacterium]
MNLTEFDALSFDCYGTLIDWEARIAAVLGPWAREHGLDLDDEALLTAYADHEARVEAETPAVLYPKILARSFQALAADLGAPLSPAGGAAPGRVGSELAGVPGLSLRARLARRAVPVDHLVERGPGVLHRQQRPARGHLRRGRHRRGHRLLQAVAA